MRSLVLVAVVLAGCYHDDPKPVVAPQKPVETGHSVLADLPKECQDYLGILDKRAHCAKLSEDARKLYSDRKDKLADALPGRLEAPVQRQQAIDECTAEHDKLVAAPLEDCGEVVAKLSPAAAKTAGNSLRDPRCTAAAKDVPGACVEYCDAMVELSACDKLPQASKDALWSSFQSMIDAMKGSKGNAEAERAASEACGQARDAVRQAASVCK